MKTLTIRLSKFEDIIKLSDIGFYWRGQSNSNWGLKTNLERQIDKTKCNPDCEKYILTEFKRKQHLYETSRDIFTNDFERLAKIQHHGGPTRLLDFTKSLFKALYFCTENFDDSVDGAVWGVNQDLVNGPHQNKDVENMLLELMNGKTSDLFSKHINKNYKHKTVVFIEPFLLNHRLNVQQGLFAIPLDNSLRFIENLNNLINLDIYDGLSKNVIDFNKKPFDMSDETTYSKILLTQVLKIVVDKDFKRSIKTKLNNLMGLSSETIFPDIDGFCKGLTDNCENNSSTFKYK
jgi:hypothetical protein